MVVAPPTVRVLTGPTGSGKSELALQLAATLLRHLKREGAFLLDAEQTAFA